MGLPPERIGPPPRNVPLMLAAQVSLGGAVSQLGWLFFGFGSIFFWLFAWQADLTGWRFREGNIGTTAGQSLGCRDTHYSVGGSRGSRGTPVYENRYRYEVDGSALTGKSYETGNCVAGGQVTVEYLLAQPGYSRIQGMRRRLLSPWAALATIFPGVGLAVAIVGLRQGRRRIRLLRDGLTAAGRVVSKVPTSAKVMGRVVYKVTVEFSSRDGAVRRATTSTNRPEVLGDEPTETVLYDPDDPANAAALDSMPGNVVVDEGGGLRAAGSRAFLILPVASVLVNAWFLR